MNKKEKELAIIHLNNNTDMEILEQDWESTRASVRGVDIIAREDDELVFIEVQVTTDSFPDSDTDPGNRKLRENTVIAYLVENPQPSCKVRFDIITVRMTGDKQCLLRHHRDALAV